ncbi:catalase family peroxidase [Rheinheimera sp. MM224]|uniref:catalase family peroxidase n=1 Tax=Rheinheimera sp. MM224 TaxID=3019969 RepID=UPI0021F8E491|nr:catalase family peroxidase [Rheinheimera sp. MM224]CAI3799637.1 Catalase-related peroxidase [Rheinheimera sp. MM224]
MTKGLITGTLSLIAFSCMQVQAQDNGNVAVKLVDTLTELAQGPHKGFRSNHAKGAIVTGHFTPSADAKNYSTAAHFSQTVPVTVRFSNATGVPNLPDADPHARPNGMAIRFTLPDQSSTDIVSISYNGFPVATPEEFLELLTAIKTNATDTNKPTKLEQFLQSHPAALTFVKTPKPMPASFANQSFFGVNSFIFENDKGAQQHFRYRIVPKAGANFLTDEAAKKMAPDFLMEEIKQRVVKTPVEFSLQAQLPNDGDPLLDGSKTWPDDRRLIELGTIKLDALPADTAAWDKQMFNPLLLTKGITATADPVLQTRPVAYSVSFGRRLQ